MWRHLQLLQLLLLLLLVLRLRLLRIIKRCHWHRLLLLLPTFLEPLLLLMPNRLLAPVLASNR